jgi:hypothetical protein
MRSFIEIINLWPSDADLARDIHVRRNRLHTMKVRNSIPVEYWLALRERCSTSKNFRHQSQ